MYMILIVLLGKQMKAKPLDTYVLSVLQFLSGGIAYVMWDFMHHCNKTFWKIIQGNRRD